MVVPTLGVDDFSQMIDHPDVNLDTVSTNTIFENSTFSNYIYLK